MQSYQQLDDTMAQLLSQIIERTKSYQVLKWQYHNPSTFNPYKLASQGYECTGLNILECHVCHHVVTFVTVEGEEKEEAKIKEELDGHHVSCTFYGDTGKVYSRAELYLRMDHLIQPVKDSYKNVANCKLYPYVDVAKFEEQVAKNSQTEMLSAVMAKSKMNLRQVKISFILTMMGWGKKSMETIECAFCGRCVNIKQYRLTTEDKQSVPANSLQTDRAQLLDLFDQHRYFCLWVYEQKGWEIYIQHLYDKLGEAEELFRNQDPEDVKKIRTLIDGYLHKFKNLINQNFEKVSKIMTECSEMVQEIEESQQRQKQIQEQVLKRKKQMQQFLDQVDTEVRAPLKRVKID